MNESSLFKDAGMFLIAFIIGSVSFQGMLLYSIQDANDLLSNNSSQIIPLFVFLLIYALIPYSMIIVWRFLFKHNKSFLILNKEINISPLSILDKVAFVLITISIILFIIILSMVFFIDNYSSLLISIANGMILLGLIAFGCYLYGVSKGINSFIKSQNLKGSIIRSLKNIKYEFRIIILVWAVVSMALTVNYYVDKSNPEIEIKLKGIEQRLIDNSKNIKDIKSQEEKKDEILKNMYLHYDNCLSEKNNKALFQLDPKINAYYDSINTINQPKINQVEFNAIFNWLSYLENKLKVEKESSEEIIEKDLFSLFYEMQQFYLALLLVLIFIGCVYWYYARISIAIQNKDNIGEEGSIQKEYEFSKLFILLSLVLVLPILKPLEQKDISFNKPLWNRSFKFNQTSKPQGVNSYVHTVDTSSFKYILEKINLIDTRINSVLDIKDSIQNKMKINFESLDGRLDRLKNLPNSVDAAKNLIRATRGDLNVLKSDVNEISKEVDKIKRQ